MNKQLKEQIKKYGYIEFSDRKVAIESGTTKSGNSLKAPIDSTHRDGLIPKAMFPQVESFEEYHNPDLITDEMKKLGQEFLKRFSINYEKVYEKDLDTLLDRDMLDVAGYAWPVPKNGEYSRTEHRPNHAFMGIRKPMTFIFDNYIDYVDGDFIKKLAQDYDFLDYGYRIIISENKKEEEKRSWWQKIWDWVKDFIKDPFK